ncbi:MAG: GNAT family N-acetyltransferase [Actinobacteria bacterium]|nr:GNAT family N-acetyltransferase [Actinomycetota bacterium]
MSESLADDFARVRPPLEGRLVRLRAVEEDDLPRLNELLWDPSVTAQLRATWPQPLGGTREWWQRARGANDERHFAIATLAGELIGNCALRHIDPRPRKADLGIFLGRPFWDQGFGTDAVRTVCRFAFREMNLQRVDLEVFEGNQRARRAYEKVGFKEEGRLRRGHFVGARHVDVIVMGVLAEELIDE